MLGAVQGVTEAVPVSSSAHLALLERAAGWPPLDPRTAQAVAGALHAGSAFGIAVALRGDLRAALREPATLVVGTLPAVVLGAVGAGAVERRVGRHRSAGLLLAGTGVLLAVVDGVSGQRRTRVTVRDAAAIGLGQAAALLPGISRAGATLTAARARGLDRPTSVRFTTVLGLPVSAGAAVLTLARTRAGSRVGPAPLLAGAATAAGAAFLAVGPARRLLTARWGACAVATYRLAVASITIRG